MSAYSFGKLFSSITESSIWCEPHGTVRVWITFIAKADRHGRLMAALPGLARLANVTLEECRAAIATLEGPDEFSRTPDYDGRRIEPIPGGWRLLNHAKYRDMRDEESRREQNREAQARHREKLKKMGVDVPGEDTTPGDDVSKLADSKPDVSAERPESAHADADAEVEAKELKNTAQPAATRFPEFWEAYPKKKGKKLAAARWKSGKFDRIADVLIADVKKRDEEDDGWLRGYVPDASTYLNQERWEDELAKPTKAQSTPSGRPEEPRRVATPEQTRVALDASKPRNVASEDRARAALEEAQALIRGRRPLAEEVEA